MALGEWLRYPTVVIEDLLDKAYANSLPTALLKEIEQDGRYAPYIGRQEAEIRDIANNDRIALPDELEYRTIAGLSNEMVERLEAARPETLAAAARVRGVTPAALAAILVHAKRARCRPRYCRMNELDAQNWLTTELGCFT